MSHVFHFDTNGNIKRYRKMKLPQIIKTIRSFLFSTPVASKDATLYSMVFRVSCSLERSIWSSAMNHLKENAQATQMSLI